jgi:hypothetical protein
MRYVGKVVSEVTAAISIGRQQWCRKHPLSGGKKGEVWHGGVIVHALG